MRRTVSARYIISALMSLFSMCMIFGMSSEARASDFVLNLSIDGLYWQDNVITNEYRDSYEMGAISFGIEPSVRFNDLYALGLDVSFGGSSMGGSGDRWRWREKDEDYSELGTILQIYITNKLIYSDSNYELWGELGIGGHALFSDGFYADDGEFYSPCLWLGVRLRLGITYFVTDNIGIGLHVNGAYMLLNNFSAGGGVNMSFRF